MSPLNCASFVLLAITPILLAKISLYWRLPQFYWRKSKYISDFTNLTKGSPGIKTTKQHSIPFSILQKKGTPTKPGVPFTLIT
jgi:hypothetical protein